MCSLYIFAFSTISCISSLCCWQPQKHHILRDQTLTSSTLLYLHLHLHAALFNFWHFAQKIHFLKPYRLECLYAWPRSTNYNSSWRQGNMYVQYHFIKLSSHTRFEKRNMDTTKNANCFFLKFSVYIHVLDHCHACCPQCVENNPQKKLSFFFFFCLHCILVKIG